MLQNNDMKDFNYLSNVNIKTTILLFFLFSFIGYVWEILLFFVKKRRFVNRGFLRGTWLPIYGYGVLLILILLKNFINKPFVLFIMIIFLCGFLEYLTSFLLEKVFHKKWWDYKDCFLNLNGRICFSGLLFFGIGGMITVYFIAPYFIIKITNLNEVIKNVVLIMLVLLFCLDNLYSLRKPNRGKNVSVNIKK